MNTAPEFDRDADGELLIDWSPAKGRMLTLSLRDDGRLSYAITWDGEKAHGTAQMPAPAHIDADKLHREILNLPCELPDAVDMSFDFVKRVYQMGHRDARLAAAERVIEAGSADGKGAEQDGGKSNGC